MILRWNIWFLLIILLFNYSYANTTAIMIEDHFYTEQMDTFRLKGLIEPLHYDINITVYLTDKIPDKQFTFNGHVSILLKTWKSHVKNIILYKRKLDINEKSIKIQSTYNKHPVIEIISNDTKYNQTTEKYALTLDGELQPGIIYNLTMEFNSTLSENMIGFYRSSYKDENNKTRWLAATQFNDKHARQAFPCFDEPKFKATFNVGLNYEYEFDAISNTEFQKITYFKRLKGTKFFKTPKMSTYLVAFLISDFKYKRQSSNFMLAVRPNVEQYANYALEIGPKLLAKLEQYLGLTYNDLGINKMDLGAIPDFAAGAMENWGLLLFKEKYLLYDAKTTPIIDEQRIATVIAHEQSHMWFGNFITLEWWNHLWVNEGFARYFEYFIPHEIYPDWELEKQFVLQQIHSSMLADSLEGTGPMTIYESITKPYNPPSAYTAISYNKGASIIRMFKYCMGSENFRHALQNLLIDRKFTYAGPENVLANFRREWSHTNIDFVKFFNDWTEQPGYPVVHISVDKNGKSISVKQNRFLLENESTTKPELNPNLTYMIPITFTTDKKQNFSIPNENEIIFIDSSKSKETINVSDEPIKWIIVNLQQIGYYRVNYDEKNWLNIKNALSDSKAIKYVHDINRANIINDLFNFGQSGLLNYSFIFDIIEFLKFETEYLPWSAALNGFTVLKMKLGNEYNNELNSFLMKLLENVYKNLGFEEKSTDNRLTVYTRSNILNSMCRCGHVDCIEKSLSLVKRHIKNELILNKNIKNILYCTALRNATENERDSIFNYIRKDFIDNLNPTEKLTTLAALGCVSSKSHIKSHFEFILNSDQIRLQDRMYAINTLIAENSNKTEFLLDLITLNFKLLGKSLGGGENSVLGIVTTISQYCTDDEHLTKMNYFIRLNKNEFSEAGDKYLSQILAKICKSIEWKKSRKDDIEKALRGLALKVSFNFMLLVFVTFICYFNY